MTGMPSSPALPLARSLAIGIVNARLNVQRHNTDHACVIDMEQLGQVDPRASVRFLPDLAQGLKANLNFVAGRLRRGRPFPSIPLRSSQLNVDALYQYGADARGLELPHRSPPLLVTAGFPGERASLSRGSDALSAEANRLGALTRAARRVHFHTEVARQNYLVYRPGDADRCFALPFFLPHLSVLDEAEIRAKFDLPETVLLFVGADGKRKGIETLCEALDCAADTLHRLQVGAVFVSRDKPTCQRFQTIRHHEKLPRSTIQRLMRAAHLYCMVPRRESYGLVFVEAMAAGCAVVADDDLPRQEILDGGRCGRLLCSGNSRALADTLVELVEDRAAALALALNARNKAASRFAPSLVGAAFLQEMAAMVPSGASV